MAVAAGAMMYLVRILPARVILAIVVIVVNLPWPRCWSMVTEVVTQAPLPQLRRTLPPRTPRAGFVLGAWCRLPVKLIFGFPRNNEVQMRVNLWGIDETRALVVVNRVTHPQP